MSHRHVVLIIIEIRTYIDLSKFIESLRGSKDVGRCSSISSTHSAYSSISSISSGGIVETPSG